MQREIEKSRSATDEYATFITETRSQSMDIDESDMTIRQALSNSNTFITIPSTQTNIHAIAPMGIFICGHMWPISSRGMHINCH